MVSPCRAFGVSETCYRYKPLLGVENELIADPLVGLTAAHKTWSFGFCFLHLRNVKGHPWNHKRIYRIYCALELNLRIKPRKRRTAGRAGRSGRAREAECDLVDGLHGPSTGRLPRFPTADVLDDFNREGLGIEVGFSLPAKRVIRSLNNIIEWRGRPRIIRVDDDEGDCGLCGIA